MQLMTQDDFLKLHSNYKVIKKDPIVFYADLFTIHSPHELFSSSGYILNDQVYLYLYGIKLLKYNINNFISLKKQIMSNYLFFRNSISTKINYLQAVLKTNLYNDHFQNKKFEIIYKGFMDNGQPVFLPHVKISEMKPTYQSLHNQIPVLLDYDDFFAQDLLNKVLFERTFFINDIESFQELNETIFKLYIRPLIEVDINDFNKGHIDILKMINI